MVGAAGMKSMNIAVVELETHAELAANLMELSTIWPSDIDIRFFFSAKVAGRVPEDSRVETVETNDVAQSLAKFRPDRVLIGTAHRFFNTYIQIARTYPTDLILHNINFASKSRAELLTAVLREDRIFRLKLLVKEGLLQYPELLSSIHRKFVLDKALSAPGTAYLPLYFHEKQPSKVASPKEKIIVIPGAADQQRRDYRLLLRRLRITVFSEPYHFILLGKLDPVLLDEILLTNLHGEANRFTLTYFQERVSVSDFHQWMSAADALYCPVHQATTYFSGAEYYGVTKISGNIGDAIRYGKPIILPASMAKQYPFGIADAGIDENFESVLQAAAHLRFDFAKDFNRQKIADEILQRLLTD